MIFCLVNQGIFGHFNVNSGLFQKISEGYRRFPKTVEDFRRLTKRSDHFRRCPKNPSNTQQYFLRETVKIKKMAHLTAITKNYAQKPHSDPLKLLETFSEKATYFIYWSAKIIKHDNWGQYFTSPIMTLSPFLRGDHPSYAKISRPGSVSAGGLPLRVCGYATV